MTPITLTSDEVRGILDGRVTQVRRVVEVVPPFEVSFVASHSGRTDRFAFKGVGDTPVNSEWLEFTCPFGDVGDVLTTLSDDREHDLRITGIRVEQVQDMSGPDFLACGYPVGGSLMAQLDGWHVQSNTMVDNAVDWFGDQWDAANDVKYDENPWVWVIDFERETP